ncbi:uncharacterized protein LOC142541802 [Primulina tabacum]|uniref:uncharacterized protein LOC142541802 n=1 Tax=Primulina tabacum TaxID=48773 RepID=UPI003F5A9620
MGRNADMSDFPKFPLVSRQRDLVESREIKDEKSVPIPSSDLLAHQSLNHAQAIAYDMIMDCVDRNSGGVLFVNGPGRTGKTYLYHAVLATFRSRGMIALATTTSGVAASILLGDQTAHSRLKIQSSYMKIITVLSRNSVGLLICYV